MSPIRRRDLSKLQPPKIDTSSPFDPLPPNVTSPTTYPRKLSPLTLHPLTTTFASPAVPQPLSTIDEVLEDYDLFFTKIQSATPKSTLVPLPASNLSFEQLQSRGFLDRGPLRVCNPSSPLDTPSPLQPVPCAYRDSEPSISRRGAIRVARPRSANGEEDDDESAPAVTFEQILCRAESFPLRRREGSRSPRWSGKKGKRNMLGRTLVRATSVFTGKKLK